MQIKKIVSQSRRDFTAIYECEHCGHEVEDYGYDDAHFHNNVIPNRKCKECGKIGHAGNRALTPKYPEGAVV